MAAPPPDGGLQALAACASLAQRLSLNLSEVLGEAAVLPDGPPLKGGSAPLTSRRACAPPPPHRAPRPAPVGRRTGAETSAAPPPSPASAASSPRSPRPRRTVPTPPPAAWPPRPRVKREPAMAASPVGQLDARFAGAMAARQGGDLQALLAQHAQQAAAAQHAAAAAHAHAQLAAAAGGAAAVAHYDYSALAALRPAAPRPPLPGLTPENPLPSKLIGRAAQAVLRPPPALTLGGGGGWLAAPPGVAPGARGGAAPTTGAAGAAGAPELDLSALQRFGFGPPDGFAPPAPPAGRGRGRTRVADADGADGGGDLPPARRRRTAAAGAARPPRGRRASDETEADGAPAPAAPAPAPAAPAPERSSRFRGVTKHRRSGRFEAHIWVRDLGRQVYLGGYEAEEHAAEAYDIAALKAKGRGANTNFEIDKCARLRRPRPPDFASTARTPRLFASSPTRPPAPPRRYADLLACIDRMAVEELVMAVRRQSQGFSRGTSAFRGVTRHPSARWEARIGVPGSKHVYLGLFVDEEEAARAYDRALVRLRGRAAATNFSLAEYRCVARRAFPVSSRRNARAGARSPFLPAGGHHYYWITIITRLHLHLTLLHPRPLTPSRAQPRDG
jgi:hypothetical protein